MFYRREILLALLEIFGGSLAKTDCQKLMFLFCLRRGKNYYDFFPHKYGNFSFLLHQDCGRLVDLGCLVKQNNVQLKEALSYLGQLQLEDRLVLQALVSEVGDLRGENLIRKVYLEVPYYVSRSEIAYKILSEDEYKVLKREQNNDGSFCLFTLGYFLWAQPNYIIGRPVLSLLLEYFDLLKHR